VNNSAHPARDGSETALLVGLVALGGFVGAAARFAVMEFVAATELPFWLATFGVNLAGCTVMGVLLARVSRLGRGSVQMQQRWRAFLGFGILGAFTTFSTFSADIIELALTSSVGAGAYMLATAITCLAGVILGERLARGGIA
jgi:CrcB protein